MAGFLGMRGTGDWATDQRPKSWRELILYLYPNGSAPLTALLSKMKEEKVSDPQFYWWTKKLPEQAAAIVGIYTDINMTTAYTSGGTAGQTLYVKVSTAELKNFRAGHQALLRDATDSRVDVNAKVTAVDVVGSDGRITVKLLENDDNSPTHDLSDADRIIVIGNINEEGAAMPTALSYDPAKYYNYTQIFRTPLSITRTARETRLRTGDAYKEMKREALELHGIEIEKAFLFGIPTENTGAVEGKPERTTAGIINFVKVNVASNWSDYRLDTTYSGDTWLTSGDAWLDNMLEKVFRYGSPEKLVLAGSGALLGLNRLVKSLGHMHIEPRQADYGIKVSEWVTPYGSLFIKTHPLLSHESTTRNMMVILEPKNLVYRFITDTTFFGEGEAKQAAPGTNYIRKDSTNEEFLTECGLELHHPDTFAVLDGVGLDNTLP